MSRASGGPNTANRLGFLPQSSSCQQPRHDVSCQAEYTTALGIRNDAIFDLNSHRWYGSPSTSVSNIRLSTSSEVQKLERVPTFRFERVVSFSDPITLTWTPTNLDENVMGASGSSDPATLRNQPLENPPGWVSYIHLMQRPS